MGEVCNYEEVSVLLSRYVKTKNFQIYQTVGTPTQRTEWEISQCKFQKYSIETVMKEIEPVLTENRCFNLEKIQK